MNLEGHRLLVAALARNRKFMSRSIGVEEYEGLKASFEVLFPLLDPNINNLPYNVRPTAILSDLENKSLAAARSGLQMAISDMVEMSIGLQPDKVFEIDGILAGKGLITLSNLRERFSKNTLLF